MLDKQNKTETESKNRTFAKRYDFYWKFISVYTIAIVIYGLLKGSIEEWTVTVVLLDPVVILLCIIVVFTYIGLLVESYKKARIIMGKDFFVLKNRFRQSKFTANEVSKIVIGREIIQGQGKFRVIKVKLYNRKRILRIRPNSYWNDGELLQEFSILKKNINR